MIGAMKPRTSKSAWSWSVSHTWPCLCSRYSRLPGAALISASSWRRVDSVGSDMAVVLIKKGILDAGPAGVGRFGTRRWSRVGSVLFREQDCRAVAVSFVVGGLGQNPDPLAPQGFVGRQQPGAVDQGLVVEAVVLVAEFST